MNLCSLSMSDSTVTSFHPNWAGFCLSGDNFHVIVLFSCSRISDLITLKCSVSFLVIEPSMGGVYKVDAISLCRYRLSSTRVVVFDLEELIAFFWWEAGT